MRYTTLAQKNEALGLSITERLAGTEVTKARRILQIADHSHSLGIRDIEAVEQAEADVTFVEHLQASIKESTTTTEALEKCRTNAAHTHYQLAVRANIVGELTQVGAAALRLSHI